MFSEIENIVDRGRRTDGGGGLIWEGMCEELCSKVRTIINTNINSKALINKNFNFD